MPLQQGRLEDEVFIGVHCPLHHVFAQAIGSREQNGFTEATFGVDREHHARSGKIGAHHRLHADRQRHRVVGEAVDLPVGDGPIREQ